MTVAHRFKDPPMSDSTRFYQIFFWKGFPILPVAACLLSWCAVFRILWGDWLVDPQYSYGFLVPVLAIGLAIKRWEDRPSLSVPSLPGSWSAFLISLSAGIFLALLIPMSVANPDWRPLGMAAALLSLIISLGLLYLWGGGRWMAHFFFPIFFLLIAVPWPRNFEQRVMSHLMSWNTGATIEVLHWSGYEALRQGNLIVIPAGVLGIEEACSGIRSLQSGLMVALFFGEFFRLSIVRRGYLLVIAVLAALTGNIIRSSMLALVASTQGLKALSNWHDPAGMMVLLLTVAAVAGAALKWRHKGRTSGDAPAERSIPEFSSLRFPRLLPALLIVLLIGSSIGSEIWFRLHENRSLPVLEWGLQTQRGAEGVTPVKIPTKTLQMLYYPQGFSELWKVSPDAQGQVFYFRWPPGRTSAQALMMHNPEVCLSNIGMHLVRPLSRATFESSAVSIPFKSYLFEQQGRPVYVFHSLLEDAGTSGSASEVIDDSPKGRFLSLCTGRRNLGERMIEVAFWNLPDEASARHALGNYLKRAMTTTPVAAPME
jgi:exosortase